MGAPSFKLLIVSHSEAVFQGVLLDHPPVKPQFSVAGSQLPESLNIFSVFVAHGASWTKSIGRHEQEHHEQKDVKNLDDMGWRL
jgi:hypothetical protein